MTAPHGSPVADTAVAAASAVGSALPAFLVGALAVQIRAEFEIGTAAFGWSVSTFFVAAALSSVALGHLAQRIGPRRQIAMFLIANATVGLVLAGAARSFWLFVACLALMGMCNSGAQSAVNLALANTGTGRLGLAIAIKQSGMPGASMLGGLAVPAIALTVGWRWAFVVAATFAAAVGIVVLVLLSDPPSRPPVHEHARRTSTATALEADGTEETGSSRRLLVATAVGVGFLAYGAGALTTWTVESAVDVGMSEGVAGLLLSAGAALGIVVRLAIGLRLDRPGARPFRSVGLFVLVGSAGVALLAAGTPAVHVAATAVAFVGGWTWPVFTNFGVVRANSARAAAATGVTQTGVYAGVFLAPLVTGTLIEHFGYGTMWLTTALAFAIGAGIALRLSDHY